MIDDVGPRTDRAEVRQNIPDRLRLGRYRSGATDVGHDSIQHYCELQSQKTMAALALVLLARLSQDSQRKFLRLSAS